MMKTMHVKWLRLLVSAALLTGFSLFAGAQTRERVHEVSAFTSIDVRSAFEVTVAKGAYGVKLTVDTVLSDYVNVYVKGNTLYVSYDEKAVPKEVKKMYRGRNAPKAVLRAIIYTPVLEGIYMDDEASLTGADTFEGANFTMELAGKANVKALSLHTSSAKFLLKKNADAVVSIDCESEINVTTENGSHLRLESRSRELNLSSSGSSQINSSSDVVSSFMVNTDGTSQISAGVNAAKVYVSSTGSSKVTVTGTASGLIVKGARSCNIDTMGLPVADAEAEMNSGTLLVSPEHSLTVDLTSGASVYYNGTPEFRISRILKSTLAPYGTK